MRDPLLSRLGATLRPRSNKVGLALTRVSGLSTMLGQHGLGAENTDIHHPRSWLLGCSLLGHCELCIGDTAFLWGQFSDLWQCSAMGLIRVRVKGPAFSRKRPLEFWDKPGSKAP